MFLYLISLFLVWRECSGVIYVMNETEYSRMPPLYKLDDYWPCLLEPGGTYCIVDIHLFSRNNSHLMRMIQGYSNYTLKHYNHTEVHRGVCVTKTCKDYQNTSQDISSVIQSCANQSLWEEYGLEGRVTEVKYCKDGTKSKTDASDLTMAVVYIVLILLNAVGSLYDFVVCKGSGQGNAYLLAFSLKRNWEKLVAPAGKGNDPRIERLKMFNGFRSITMATVIFSHTVLIMAYSYVDNPLYIERSYEDPLKQLVFNGSLVTHTFFVMSAFLLAYNFEIYSEKHSVNWVHFPKGVLLRWLRLTPSYALVLATIATLIRHLGDGPLWDLLVTSEANACRSYWWAHLLYVNNYVYDDVYCLPQTWYLAADTQLFCLGLLVCVVARGPKARKVTLSVMLVLSIIIPALHTYFEDLDAVVMQSPESYRNIYAHDNTFRLLYSRGHTNLSTYTLGLAGGFLAYYWQKEGITPEKKNYRWGVWSLFLIGLVIILSGGLFYIDGVEPPTALRVIYAALYKPMFQINVVLLIFGCIFKIETVYRGILEWRGFTWTGRVSYGAFLMHTLFQRGLAGIQVVPIFITDYSVLMFLGATLLLSFSSGAVLWLCVEAPAGALVRILLAPTTTKETGEQANKI